MSWGLGTAGPPCQSESSAHQPLPEKQAPPSRHSSRVTDSQPLFQNKRNSPVASGPLGRGWGRRPAPFSPQTRLSCPLSMEGSPGRAPGTWPVHPQPAQAPSGAQACLARSSSALAARVAPQCPSRSSRMEGGENELDRGPNPWLGALSLLSTITEPE